MKVLVIGNGGREHALAWKLKQSPRVWEVIVAPGNAGTATEAGIRNVAVDANDTEGLIALVRQEGIDLTVVGPETPLVAGIVDRFRAEGLRCFGPRKIAAQLEGSKIFAKAFLQRHNIPTARYAVFSELNAALAYVRTQPTPIVIKADGLAAGKGVVVALTLSDAEQALHDMLGAHALGAAGTNVVIEEFLAGEEVSYIVISDGQQALPLATSQDHKRRDDADLGPNTGGMGAYSPAAAVNASIEQRILHDIIQPTLAGMAAEGAPFIGFLYAGLMITPEGIPKVIEFNVRFGDPEAQPVLMRLRSDLFDLIDATLDGRLSQITLEWDSRPALGVVLASGGYPGPVHNGIEIKGLKQSSDTNLKIFQAGTKLENGKVLTAGGRVLSVCALGENLLEAQQRAYAAMRNIQLDGSFYRRDIGHRALRT